MNTKATWGKSAKALLETELPPREWGVNGLLPPGLVFLAGSPKAGKSIMALQLAKAITHGDQFLGREVKPGNVLYFALEDDQHRLQDRMYQQGWDLHAQAFDMAFLTYGDVQDRLQEQEKAFTNALLEDIDWEDYRLIIIDTMSRMVDLERGYLNQDKSKDMTKLLGRIQAKAQKTGTIVLIIDHHGKAAGMDGRARDPMKDVMGSTAKTAVADTSWGFYRDPKTGTGTLLVRSRDLPDEVIPLVLDGDSLTWDKDPEAQSTTEPEAPKAPELTDNDEQLLETLREKGPMTRYKLAQEVGRNRNPVYKQVTKLINRGELVDTDGQLLIPTVEPTPEPEPETTEPEPDLESQLEEEPLETTKTQTIDREATIKALGDREKKVLETIQIMGPLTYPELISLSGIDDVNVSVGLMRLKKAGLIKTENTGPNLIYEITEDPEAKAQLEKEIEKRHREYEQDREAKRQKELDELLKHFGYS